MSHNPSDPYETVAFFVGGRVEPGSSWVWPSGEEVGEEAQRCHDDHHVGDCLAVTWEQQRGCRFSLTDIDCKRKERFICERDPQ